MKTIILLLMSFLWTGYAHADDCGPLGCMFQPGTVCVAGKCVPKTPTTAPTPTPPPTATNDCGALGCIFQPGTICVAGKCVPKTSPTPTPTTTPTIVPISLDMVPLANIVPKEIACSGMAMKNIRVYLTRNSLAPKASFYSVIYNTHESVGYYSSHKDLMNRYVFLRLDNIAGIQPQYYGLDFVFNIWENKAFQEVLSTLTCEQLKQYKYFFLSGISIKGDFSDFEGATFTFK